MGYGLITRKILREFPEFFDSFSPCISKDGNRELIKNITEEEIITTLSHVSNLKALGPDRLQASFYERY